MRSGGGPAPNMQGKDTLRHLHRPMGQRFPLLDRSAPSDQPQGARMKSARTRLLTLLLAAAAAPTVMAAEHVVTQKNKAFGVKKLRVKAGDVIKFTNEDNFAHNVFSLSTAKSFDTGSFGNGQVKSVTFDKPGKVEVECAIHPDMRLDVEVEP